MLAKTNDRLSMVKHETSRRLISKKGRPTPATWRRADPWSSHTVTIHVLVRTFAVRVRHQARFRMQKFQVNDLFYVQESPVCLLELLEQTVNTIIIINCLHLLQDLSFLNNHSVVVK